MPATKNACAPLTAPARERGAGAEAHGRAGEVTRPQRARPEWFLLLPAVAFALGGLLRFAYAEAYRSFGVRVDEVGLSIWEIAVPAGAPFIIGAGSLMPFFFFLLSGTRFGLDPVRNAWTAVLLLGVGLLLGLTFLGDEPLLARAIVALIFLFPFVLLLSLSLASGPEQAFPQAYFVALLFWAFFMFWLEVSPASIVISVLPLGLGAAVLGFWWLVGWPASNLRQQWRAPRRTPEQRVWQARERARILKVRRRRRNITKRSRARRLRARRRLVRWRLMRLWRQVRRCARSPRRWRAAARLVWWWARQRWRWDFLGDLVVAGALASAGGLLFAAVVYGDALLELEKFSARGTDGYYNTPEFTLLPDPFRQVCINPVPGRRVPVSGRYWLLGSSDGVTVLVDPVTRRASRIPSDTILVVSRRPNEPCARPAEADSGLE